MRLARCIQCPPQPGTGQQCLRAALPYNCISTASTGLARALSTRQATGCASLLAQGAPPRLPHACQPASTWRPLCPALLPECTLSTQHTLAAITGSEALSVLGARYGHQEIKHPAPRCPALPRHPWSVPNRRHGAGLPCPTRLCIVPQCAQQGRPRAQQGSARRESRGRAAEQAGRRGGSGGGGGGPGVDSGLGIANFAGYRAVHVLSTSPTQVSLKSDTGAQSYEPNIV